MKIISAVFFLLFVLSQQVNAQSEKGKFRLSGDFGYGYRLAKVPSNIPDELKDYVKDLKSGVVFDASLDYSIDSNWGVGVYFSRFFSKNSAFVNLSLATADNIRLTYLAPYVFFKNTSENGLHTLRVNFSAGFLGYTNNGNVNSDFFEVKANTFGVAMGLDYDIHVSEYVSLGAGVKLIAGSTSEFEVTENGQTRTEKISDRSVSEDRESLSRLNLTLGLKIYL